MNKAQEYEEIQLVGRGAYGTVKLVQRKQDGKLMIHKEIPMSQMTAEDRQQAMNEVYVHKMLPPHSNIIQHHDHFIHDQALVIVMEYAEGGTLYDLIRERGNSLFEESEILHYFVQLVIGLHHIHSKSILHRDIKTQNILLSADKSVLKLSDFGISKILSSKSKAYSVVGTPCYISPELCESKPYNQKSDIWALGCILYELCTLNRAFEAPTLPALVFKIMKGSYTHISDRYSPELRQLIRLLLNLDANKRPNVSQILAQPIMVKVMYGVIVSIGAIKMKIPPADSNQADSLVSRCHTIKKGNEASGVTAVYFWGGRSNLPFKLPTPQNYSHISEVAISRTQKLGLTNSGKVIAWEAVENTEHTIQLPGMAESSQLTFIPRLLEGQGGLTISKIACGDLFAACVTDRGILMTFGSGSSGCLGHGNHNDVKQLKIVEALIGSEVMEIGCGANHVAVVTTEQEIFTWGNGDHGRLGHGNTTGHLTPKLLEKTAFESNIVKISCGLDATVFLTRNDKAYVCGNNRENKLALDFIDSTGECCSVQSVPTPTRIKHSLLSAVTKCAIGYSHSAFLTAGGEVVLCGSNTFGQLGKSEQVGARSVLRLELSARFTDVACGDAFVVAATRDRELLSWGKSSRGRLGRLETRLSGSAGIMSPGRVELPTQSLTNITAVRCSHDNTLVVCDLDSES